MSEDSFEKFNKIDPDKIDFSMFHPLDHSLWRCVGYPGGRRTHLDYSWEWKWKRILRTYTLCKIGRHQFVAWHQRFSVERVYEACMNCGKRK